MDDHSVVPTWGEVATALFQHVGVPGILIVALTTSASIWDWIKFGRKTLGYGKVAVGATVGVVNSWTSRRTRQTIAFALSAALLLVLTYVSARFLSFIYYDVTSPTLTHSKGDAADPTATVGSMWARALVYPAWNTFDRQTIYFVMGFVGLRIIAELAGMRNLQLVLLVIRWTVAVPIGFVAVLLAAALILSPLGYILGAGPPGGVVAACIVGIIILTPLPFLMMSIESLSRQLLRLPNAM